MPTMHVPLVNGYKTLLAYCKSTVCLCDIFVKRPNHLSIKQYTDVTPTWRYHSLQTLR